MTIAQVSKKYDITPDTLRYYERIGLIPPVPRNKSGIRDYDESSCRWVEFIKCMRNAGMEIEALIEYVTLYKEGKNTALARKNLLIEQKEKFENKLEDITSTIDRLNYKIKLYDEITNGKRKGFMEEP